MALNRCLTLAFFSVFFHLMDLALSLGSCEADVTDLLQAVEEHKKKSAKDFRFTPDLDLLKILHSLTESIKPGQAWDGAIIQSTIDYEEKPGSTSLVLTAAHPHKEDMKGKGRIVCLEGLEGKCKAAILKLKEHLRPGTNELTCFEGKGALAPQIRGADSIAVDVFWGKWKESFYIFEAPTILADVFYTQKTAARRWTFFGAKLKAEAIEFMTDDGGSLVAPLEQPVLPEDLDYYQAAINAVDLKKPYFLAVSEKDSPAVFTETAKRKRIQPAPAVAKDGDHKAKEANDAERRSLPASAVGKLKKHGTKIVAELRKVLSGGRKSDGYESL